MYIGTNSNNYFQISNNSGTMAMVVTQGGFVGINNGSPPRTLTVGGDIALQGSAGYAIYDWDPNDTNWRIGMSSSPPFTCTLGASYYQYVAFANGAGTY